MTSVAGANRRAGTACIVAILGLRALSYGMIGLTLPLYFVGIGRSAGEWGVAAGLAALASVFGEASWGWAADRLGTAIPLLVGTLATATAAPLYGLTRTLGLLLALQVGRGFLEVASAPAGRRAMAHALGPGHRAVGIGLFQAISSAGTALGPLLAGALLSRWGHEAAFVACAASATGGALLALVGRRVLDPPGGAEGPAPAHGEAPAGAPDAPSAGPISAAFVTIAAVAVCLFAGGYGGRAFVPLLGTEVLGLGAERIASVLAIAGLLGGLANVAGGRLADVWGRRPVLALGLLAVATSMLVYSLAHSAAALTAGAILSALGMALGIPAGVALVSDLVPYRRQGRMIGLYGGCEDIGIMLGPLACGLLWDAVGPRSAFLAVALLPVLGALGVLVVQEKGNPTGSGRSAPR